MAWNDFEHSIWKQLKSVSLTDRSQFILAVSGGLDSMVLVWALQKLKPQAQIIVAHFHHGDSDRYEVQTYRDQAFDLVKTYCESKNLRFFSCRSSEKLKSEAEFREKRLAFFSELKSDFPEAIFATAHHKDDLLETWLIKMIRGTSADGLENFKLWNQHVLRPLLSFTKSEIISYAQAEGVVWIDDPTNQESDYLRNWIRNEWLQSLADKIPGSIENLTNSLQRLISEVKVDDEVIAVSYEYLNDNNPTKALIDRIDFLQLSRGDQLKTLAKAMKGLGQRHFSQGQLEEIIKRLDKNQKELIFNTAGVNWFINAKQIVLELY